MDFLISISKGHSPLGCLLMCKNQFWFPLCKYSHRGWFPTTNMVSLNADVGTQWNDPVLFSGGTAMWFWPNKSFRGWISHSVCHINHANELFWSLNVILSYKKQCCQVYIFKHSFTDFRALLADIIVVAALLPLLPKPPLMPTWRQWSTNESLYHVHSPCSSRSVLFYLCVCICVHMSLYMYFCCKPGIAIRLLEARILL